MKLSDDQKIRIYNEEAERVAQDTYRAQVRRDLLANSGSGNIKSLYSLRSHWIVVFTLICILSLIVYCRSVNGRQINSAPNALSSESKTTIGSSAISDPSISKSPSQQFNPRLTTPQVAQMASPAVVLVKNYGQNGELFGQGSGYVFSADGVIITNYHVIRGANKVEVTLPSREPVQVQNLLGYSVQHDVAALQIPGNFSNVLSTQDLQENQIGDHVIAIGSPLGLDNTVSDGIISGFRMVSGKQMIQTNAPISHGSSGGPLLNDYGKVIGITTAGRDGGQNLNLAVPAKYILELLSAKRVLSLEEMLSETRIIHELAENSISIPAHQMSILSFDIPLEQGVRLGGSYSVSGGSGNDVEVALLDSSNRVMINSGRVSGYGQLSTMLSRGSYKLLFDNRFSTFSSKSISPDIKLESYR